MIDRSDWNQLVNLDGDDGYTLIGNRTGWSMKYSYLQILPRLRAALEKAQKPGASPYIMLDNTVGFGWLPFMKSFDGTYSEGANFNSVGLLGLDSTSILWTSSRKECCSTAAAADTYFQARLRMGVFPQAPFPENDHCIQPDPNSTADYLRCVILVLALPLHGHCLLPHFSMFCRSRVRLDHCSDRLTGLVTFFLSTADMVLYSLRFETRRGSSTPCRFH